MSPSYIVNCTKYYSVTLNTTYLTVTPNLPKRKFPSNRAPSKYKCPPYRRNSRIIQAGLAHTWKSFITLSFDDSHYNNCDYDFIQCQFRHLMNKKIPRKVEKSFKYLGVLEHGTSHTHRAHYHILTDLDISEKIFETRTDKYGRPHLHLPIWTSGFTDVQPLDGSRFCVFYLIKYLGKSGKRTPPGKRELFMSRGLYKPKKIVLDALDLQILLNTLKAEKTYQNMSTEIYNTPINLQKLCYNISGDVSDNQKAVTGQLPFDFYMLTNKKQSDKIQQV